MAACWVGKEPWVPWCKGHGHWRNLPINNLALPAIRLFLQFWTILLEGHLIWIHFDNPTMVMYSNQKSHHKEVGQILSWAECHVSGFFGMYIPSHNNWQADRLQHLDPGEWFLHLEMFQGLCPRWVTPDADLLTCWFSPGTGPSSKSSGYTGTSTP